MLSDRCVDVGVREKSSEAFDVLLDQLCTRSRANQLTSGGIRT
jgi:hypothetical protein